jgi:hypothetical protein
MQKMLILVVLAFCFVNDVSLTYLNSYGHTVIEVLGLRTAWEMFGPCLNQAQPQF